LTSAEKAAVMQAVKGVLKDPDSARFKWTTLRAGSSTYCGLVDAKNSFGGYVGDTAFEVVLSTQHGQPNVDFVGMDGTDQYGLIGIRTRCRESYGIDLSTAK
jgi:hypothetical protein